MMDADELIRIRKWVGFWIVCKDLDLPYSMSAERLTDFITEWEEDKRREG